MRYCLKSKEDLVFLKNEKTLMTNSMHGYLFRIKYKYSTVRGNENSRSVYLICFSPRKDNCPSLESENLFIQEINNFNKLNPFRKLESVQIISNDMIEVSKVSFTNGCISLDFNTDLNHKKSIVYNNLIIHEALYEYEKKNKKKQSIIYALDFKSERLIDDTRNYISHCLNPKTHEIKLLKNKPSKQVKISNVKILDILKSTKVDIA